MPLTLRFHPGILVPALALVLAACAVMLLFRGGVGWSNPEYLVFSVPGAVEHGVHFRSRDLLKAFDPLPFDEVRPRFLNYLITVLNVKFRLALYEHFIPPVNLSLMLLGHLLASPLLLYLTVRNLLASRTIALSAACLYATSVGFLSAGAVFVQPGKVLIHPLALLLLWLLSLMHRRNAQAYFVEHSPALVGLVFAINLVALSVDDSYAIVAIVACVLFWRLFIPHSPAGAHLRRSLASGVVFFIPFLLFAAFVWKLAPELSAAAGAGRCDYFGYIAGQSATTVAKTPLWAVFRDLATTALASTFLVRPYPEAMSAVALRLSSAHALLVSALLVGCALFAHRRTRHDRSVPVGAAFTALAVYLVLQAVLQRFHVQITGGYYYASLSGVFISILAACVLASLPTGKLWIGQAVLLGLMAFQIANFLDLNRRWKIMHMPLIPYSLSTARAIYPNVVTDDGAPLRPEQAARMEKIWSDWKDGQRRDLSQEPRWPGSTAWFLVEINALSGFVYRDPIKRCGEPGPRAPS